MICTGAPDSQSTAASNASMIDGVHAYDADPVQHDFGNSNSNSSVLATPGHDDFDASDRAQFCLRRARLAMERWATPI